MSSVLQEAPAGYTFTEAWKRLGVAKATFVGYCKDGKIRQLPGVPARYCAEDVEQMVAQRTTHATMSQAIPADLLTGVQLTAQYGISRMMIYQYVQAGRLHPSMFPGLRTRLYQRVEVERLVAEQRDRQQRRERGLPAGLCTAMQARQLLDIEAVTLGGWAREGRIQRRWVPGRHLPVYDLEEVQAIAEARRQRHDARLHGHPDLDAYTALYRCVFASDDDLHAGKGSPAVRYLRFHHRVSVEDAQDVVQQVMVALWEDGAAFFAAFPDLKTQQKAVLVQFRHRLYDMVSARRTQWKTAEQSGHQFVMNGYHPSVEQEVISRERWQVVIQQARRSPKKQQIILGMVAQGFTYGEIAAYLRQHQMGLSVPMVQEYRTQMAEALHRALVAWDEGHPLP